MSQALPETKAASFATGTFNTTNSGGVPSVPGDNEPLQILKPVTLAEIPMIDISIEIDSFRTTGYAAHGDGGEGFYVRAASEPAHAGKVQSNDGAWWRLVPEKGAVSVLQFGAVRDASATPATSSHQAFQDAIDFVTEIDGASRDEGLTIHVPAGIYYWSDPVYILNPVEIIGTVRTEIEAAPDITALTVQHGFGTPTGSQPFESENDAGGTVIRELRLLCNATAYDVQTPGLRVRARCHLHRVRVFGAAGAGIHIQATFADTGISAGNANAFSIHDCMASDNRGDGLLIEGTDTNAGQVVGFTAIGNERWGIRASSFLGNTISGLHLDGNGPAFTGTIDDPDARGGCSYNGQRYLCRFGASEADYIATTPGTDDDVWIPIGAGGDDGNFYPEWTGTEPEGRFVSGGPIVTDQSFTGIFGAYFEPNQYPAQVKGMLFTGHVAEKNAGGGPVFAGSQVYGKLAFRAQNFAENNTNPGLTLGAEGRYFRTETEGFDHFIKFSLIGEIAQPRYYFSLHSQEGQVGSYTLSFFEKRHDDAPFGLDVTAGEIGQDIVGLDTPLAFKVATEYRQWDFRQNTPDAYSFQPHADGDIIWNFSVSSAQPEAGVRFTAQFDPATDALADKAVELWEWPTLDRALHPPRYTKAAIDALDATAHDRALLFSPDYAGGAPALVVSDETAWRALPLGGIATGEITDGGQVSGVVAWNLATQRFLRLEPTGDTQVFIDGVAAGADYESVIELVGAGDHMVDFYAAGSTDNAIWVGGKPTFASGTGRDLVRAWSDGGVVALDRLATGYAPVAPAPAAKLGFVRHVRDVNFGAGTESIAVDTGTGGASIGRIVAVISRTEQAPTSVERDGTPLSLVGSVYDGDGSNDNMVHVYTDTSATGGTATYDIAWPATSKALVLAVWTVDGMDLSAAAATSSKDDSGDPATSVAVPAGGCAVSAVITRFADKALVYGDGGQTDILDLQDAGLGSDARVGAMSLFSAAGQSWTVDNASGVSRQAHLTVAFAPLP